MAYDEIAAGLFLEVEHWKKRWEVAEENRGALSVHAGNMEHQLDKREAEIQRLLTVIELARDNLNDVIE